MTGTPDLVDKPSVSEEVMVRVGVLNPVDPSFNFKNPKNQYWKCKYKNVNFTITPSGFEHDPTSGRILPKKGLSLTFMDGKWSINRAHPDRKMIEGRLRASDTAKNGVLVCMDDIPEDRKHLIDSQQIGDGPAQKLAAMGIHTQQQLDHIREQVGGMDAEEKAELRKEVESRDVAIKERDEKLETQGRNIETMEQRLKELEALIQGSPERGTGGR